MQVTTLGCWRGPGAGWWWRVHHDIALHDLSDGSEASGIFAMGTSPQSSSEGLYLLLQEWLVAPALSPTCSGTWADLPFPSFFPSLLQQSSKVAPQSWCGTGGGVGCSAPQLQWWQVAVKESGHQARAFLPAPCRLAGLMVGGKPAPQAFSTAHGEADPRLPHFWSGQDHDHVLCILTK